MLSNFISSSAVLLVYFMATAQAATWNAVFTQDEGGLAFLDSNNAKTETSIAASVDTVNGNSDKGERFRFPTGSGGILISQAHENHAVGYDSSKEEFHADFAQNHFDALVKVILSSDGTTSTFCNNDVCIGPGGRPTTTPFSWNVQQIRQA